MELLSRRYLIPVVVASFILLSLPWVRSQAAGEDDPPPRQTDIVISYTTYQWWLVRWDDNEIVCTLVVDQEGLPTTTDIEATCEEDVYDNWLSAPPCVAAADGTSTEDCKGYYLFFVNSRASERTVLVDLPVPTMALTLAGCIPSPPNYQCDKVPALVFSATEPLPNESITRLNIRVGDKIYACSGAACQIPMIPTGIDGVDVEFWADSSFGDESEHFTARVRIVDAGVPAVPGEGKWFVHVLSSQWHGGEVESCAATWEAFPPLGDPPHWLSTPPQADQLSSNTPFVYLAGQLITGGTVDASGCPYGGLLPSGAASACGVEQARFNVDQWQDRFDNRILEVSQDRNIPAQLLKNLFAQESQFWPGEIIAKEYGLGQLTFQGADATLLWNLSFYDQFCPFVLAREECKKGYAHLDVELQEMLRGALVSQTNASCQGCEFGINLNQAQFSVDLFAQTLLGNCDQVSYMIHDVTGKTPGVVSTYEDLWRYTLVNYNAGPGCLLDALQQANRKDRVLNWQTVSDRMGDGCQNALVYVDRVTRTRAEGIADFVPTPTPKKGFIDTKRSLVAPTPAPTPVLTPVPFLAPYP